MSKHAGVGADRRVRPSADTRVGAYVMMLFAAASVGKFGGSLIAARITGLGWREGAALGVLMNTRGLMELIVLNIGYEMHIISPTLFAMMVLMALLTTMMTNPVLNWIERRKIRSQIRVPG